MNRIRDLLCGHTRIRVVDYDDEAYRWLVSCCECGRLEHWSQSEFSANLKPPTAELAELLTTAEDDA